MRFSRMFCLALFVGATLLPATALAQAQTIASGEQQYRDKDYRGALGTFEYVQASSAPTPQLSRYIGLCHDNLGEFTEAVTAYEHYLESTPAPKDQAAYDGIKARVAQLRMSPGKVMVTSTPAGAIIHVDGGAGGKTTPAELVIPPGQHTLAFDREGYARLERTVDITFASKQNLTVELTELPKPQTLPPQPPLDPLTPPVPPLTPAGAPPSSPTEPANKTAAYVLGGIAVVGVGLCTGFGIAALGKKSDYNRAPTEARAESAEKMGLAADLALGAAFVTGVTSLVLFLRSDAPQHTASDPIREARITATPFFSREGGGVAGAVRF